MATRKQRLGAALEGFTQTFWPAYLNLQENKRRKLADRQRFLTSIGGQIQKGWQNIDDLEPHIESYLRDYGGTREEAIDAFSQYVPTEQQRGAEVRRRLGDDPAKWLQSVAQAHAEDVGAEDYYQARRALPSTPFGGVFTPPTLPSSPISGLVGLAGAPPRVDATGNLLEPPSIADQPVGMPGEYREIPKTLPSSQIGGGLDTATGRMFAPLEQPQRPFVPGATGGTPLEWGGPQAELFDTQVKEALAREDQEAAQQRKYDALSLRQQLNITEEIKEEYWDKDTDRLVRRALELMPLERDEFIAQYRERLEAQRDDEMIRMDPTGDFAKRYYNEQRKLAILSAIVNDRPEWFNRMDPKTGEPRTYSVTKDWQTGALRFSEVTGSFGDTAPYSAFGGGRQVAQDPMHTYMFGTVLTGLTEEGMDTDLSNPDVQQMILQRSIEMGIPGETAIEFIENMRQRGGPPPKIAAEPGGPTPQITENIYGPDSYEPDGNMIFNKTTGSIEWEVPDERFETGLFGDQGGQAQQSGAGAGIGGGTIQISNEQMMEREVGQTIERMGEERNELSETNRLINVYTKAIEDNPNMPILQQEKADLESKQDDKTKLLKALENKLKAIQSYFGSSQNQQNLGLQRDVPAIGSRGVLPQ